MQIANFLSVRICNWGSKIFVTQTPLIGYFVSHAKKNPIGPFFLRREPSYPLWWVWLIQRFCNKLRLRRLIQRYVNVSGRTGTYRPAELILARLLPRAPVPRCVAMLRKLTAASTVPNLQMTDPFFSSEARRELPSFAHF